MLRQELGYRGSGETLKREEFEARKKAAEQARMNKLRAAPKALSSASKDLSGFPFLASLAEREEMVRNGKLTVRPTPRRQARSCLWSCALRSASAEQAWLLTRARLDAWRLADDHLHQG